MTKYRYNDESIIKEITFKKADNGIPRAYLCANQNATEADLASITSLLCNKGYLAIHSMCDGKPALEVRGYLFEKQLVNLLDEHVWTRGKAEIIKDKAVKKSTIQWVRDNSLPLASTGFIAADIGYTTYGHKSGRPEDTLAGLSYMAGSATMGLLGTNAQATAEIRHHVKKLVTYAKDHHLDLSKNLTVPVVTENNKRSVFQNTIDFLQTYPAEIGNSFTALAGTLIAYSSWKYRVGPNIKKGLSTLSHSDKVAHSAGIKDIGLGMSTLTGGMIGAWVKEKKHDPDAPPAEGLNAIMEWIQEKPLRVAGFLYMVSTGCHALSTIQEFQHAKSIGDKKALGAIPGRAAFIGFTILAEILLTISSKGHGDGVKSDPSTDDSVISVAAEMIVQQKPKDQAALIENIGTFLGRPDILGGKDRDITAQLAEKVEAMRHNPWIKAVSAAQLEASSLPEVSKAWQAKMAASHAVPPQLGA